MGKIVAIIILIIAAYAIDAYALGGRSRGCYSTGQALQLGSAVSTEEDRNLIREQGARVGVTTSAACYGLSLQYQEGLLGTLCSPEGGERVVIPSSNLRVSRLVALALVIGKARSNYAAGSISAAGHKWSPLEF